MKAWYDIEIWKPIRGYEGKYEISNYGNVKSVHYKGSSKEVLLTPCDNQRGYLFVGLRNGTPKKDYRYVHRLVAEHFIWNKDGLPQVNHKDEDKTHNHFLNLEFCSASYNLAYGTRHEREIKTQQNTHPNRKAVNQYTLDGVFVKSYSSQREAERKTGIWCTSISSCCRKKIETAGGFIWRYK